MEYKLTPMTAEQIPQIAAIERDCFSRPWSEEMLREELWNDSAVVIAAEGENGAVLGYAGLQTVLDEGYINNVAVAPQFRRQGIADELISAFVRFGQAKLAFLTLEVRASNAPAIALYEKHGFAPVGRRKNYYDDPAEDAVLMTLRFDTQAQAAITLGERTAETAALYFEKTDNEAIRRVLPQKAKSVEEAVADFHASQLPGASSFGRTILADGAYVGDVWCYGIHEGDAPDAMVSFCVFEQELWGRGVGTKALELFLREIAEKFGLDSVGAFTFADNLPSIRVLEKNGFRLAEEFAEDGVASKYFEWRANG